MAELENLDFRPFCISLNFSSQAFRGFLHEFESVLQIICLHNEYINKYELLSLAERSPFFPSLCFFSPTRPVSQFFSELWPLGQNKE